MIVVYISVYFISLILLFENNPKCALYISEYIYNLYITVYI